MPEPSVFAHCIHKIEIYIKHLLTPKTVYRGQTVDSGGNQMRKNFICDSHPAICRVCINIRSLLKLGHLPLYYALTTKHGVFLYFKPRPLYFQVPGGMNFNPLYNHKLTERKILRSREVPVIVKREYYFPPKGAQIRQLKDGRYLVETLIK